MANQLISHGSSNYLLNIIQILENFIWHQTYAYMKCK